MNLQGSKTLHGTIKCTIKFEVCMYKLNEFGWNGGEKDLNGTQI